MHQNEHVPADIIILNTSEQKGFCFVETKNLDGETNLKIKYINKDLQTIFQSLNVIKFIIFINS